MEDIMEDNFEKLNLLLEQEQDREKFIKAFMSKVIMYLYEDAVKQGKHRFFDGCPDTGKYSSVCDAFKTMGLAIFGPTFKESFYDKED